MVMDVFFVIMVGCEIEIFLIDFENVNMIIYQKKFKSIWKWIYLCLQDNCMKGYEFEEFLNDFNEYCVLKKIFNIIFIIVGVIFFVVVVVSVIYFFIGKYK